MLVKSLDQGPVVPFEKSDHASHYQSLICFVLNPFNHLVGLLYDIFVVFLLYFAQALKSRVNFNDRVQSLNYQSFTWYFLFVRAQHSP